MSDGISLADNLRHFSKNYHFARSNLNELERLKNRSYILESENRVNISPNLNTDSSETRTQLNPIVLPEINVRLSLSREAS